MTPPVDVRLFFNFRSPYCYLASKTLWDVFEDYHTRLVWRPLGGWSGRSDPDRFKMKVAVVRQDVKRFAKRLGAPFNPPPVTTDPTRAGAGSLLAERQGCLKPYVTEIMHAEWGEGSDIGETAVLRDVAARIGLDPDALEQAADDPSNRAVLERNAGEAAESKAFGVPTFIIGEEIFWGNDRLDFVREHLRELHLAVR